MSVKDTEEIVVPSESYIPGPDTRDLPDDLRQYMCLNPLLEDALDGESKFFRRDVHSRFVSRRSNTPILTLLKSPNDPNHLGYSRQRLNIRVVYIYPNLSLVDSYVGLAIIESTNERIELYIPTGYFDKAQVSPELEMLRLNNSRLINVCLEFGVVNACVFLGLRTAVLMPEVIPVENCLQDIRILGPQTITDPLDTRIADGGQIYFGDDYPVGWIRFNPHSQHFKCAIAQFKRPNPPPEVVIRDVVCVVKLLWPYVDHTVPLHCVPAIQQVLEATKFEKTVWEIDYTFPVVQQWLPEELRINSSHTYSSAFDSCA